MNRQLAWRLAIAALLALAVFACNKNNTTSSPAPIDDDAADDDASPAGDELATARALADQWIASYPPQTMGWSWDSGVVMLGMWNLWQLTQNAAYHDYVQQWMDYQLSIGYFIAYNDHVPPARLALRLWQETGDPKYRAPVDDAKNYIFNKAQRLPDGALVHMGWQTPQQIWVDSLYMITPFLVEVGAADQQAAPWTEAILQFTTFAAHLRDPDTGMYRHRFDQRTGALTPPVKDYWGRGNAWVIAASGTAMHLLPASTPGLDGVSTRFAAQLAGMTPLQRWDDRWTTVMNRPDTYLETSVGPLVAYGIYEAAQANLATADELTLADRALAGALDQVVKDAAGETILLGTSYGTAPSTWAMYNYVLKGEQVDYGVGAVLLAVTSRVKLGRTAALPPPQPTSDTYISPPATDADPTTWGWFYVARGNFDAAIASFDQALGADANNSTAQLGCGLIGGIRFAMDVLNFINHWQSGDASFLQFLEETLSEGAEVGQALLPRTQIMTADPKFGYTMQRLVMTEQGGSTAVGTVRIDPGVAYLLGAAAQLLIGAGDVGQAFGMTETAKLYQERNWFTGMLRRIRGLRKVNLTTLGQGLDAFIAADDLLVSTVNAINAQTGDQSLELLPRNLIYLTGDWDIPGVLMPTPVQELLRQIGIDPATLFGGKPMPGALLDFLAEVRSALVFVRGLLPS